MARLMTDEDREALGAQYGNDVVVSAVREGTSMLGEDLGKHAAEFAVVGFGAPQLAALKASLDKVVKLAAASGSVVAAKEPSKKALRRALDGAQMWKDLSLAWMRQTVADLSGDNMDPALRAHLDKLAGAWSTIRGMHGSPEELFRAVTTGLEIFADSSLAALYAARAVPAALVANGKQVRVAFEAARAERVVAVQRSPEAERELNRAEGRALELLRAAFDVARAALREASPARRGLYKYKTLLAKFAANVVPAPTPSASPPA